MDTNKMREQFEDWASAQFVMPVEVIKECRYEGTYANTVLNIAWRGWEASREAVVVELPSACAYEGLTDHLGSVIELSYEDPEHDPVGLARLPDVRAAIEVQGLKVSGSHSSPNN